MRIIITQQQQHIQQQKKYSCLQNLYTYSILITVKLIPTVLGRKGKFIIY